MKGKPLGSVLPHIVLISYLFVILYPLLWVLNSSFKQNKEIITSPWSFPEQLTLTNYMNAWTSSNVDIYFLNSLYISVFSAVATLILGTATAYAIARMKFPRLSKLVSGALMLALLIPAGSLLVPLYILLRKMHIYNTPFALVMPYVTFGLPLTVFIVAAYLTSIPRELEEAGIMDGLSAYGLLRRIIMPITMPTLVTVFMLNFLSNWNEYMMANLFLAKEKLRTLPVAMVAFYDQLNMNYGSLCAAIMFSVIPVVLIYVFLQNRIIEGLTTGSNKG
ncbi:carbohydrate ABC transporter permease [Paenibacillus sp. SYP-B3998]|uniref:Carbohydrate ABC transporter permease n=1 Tax=Paenibacillus sp. SYP-B3998 TaxID=2678564 RepID=A0A6G3ZQW1_9BACL|nr:carbohydrate ABC transporter permease [Paenibacillus sp. SYP-B3998]NEW04593.1 carbohydrate ABC transporter permease [Paenibacillus sp. SYP-B3998]